MAYLPSKLNLLKIKLPQAVRSVQFAAAFMYLYESPPR